MTTAEAVVSNLIATVVVFALYFALSAVVRIVTPLSAEASLIAVFAFYYIYKQN